MTHQVLLGAPYSGQTPSKTTTNPTAEVRHDSVTSPTIMHTTHPSKTTSNQLKYGIALQKLIV